MPFDIYIDGHFITTDKAAKTNKDALRRFLTAPNRLGTFGPVPFDIPPGATIKAKRRKV